MLFRLTKRLARLLLAICIGVILGLIGIYLLFPLDRLHQEVIKRSPTNPNYIPLKNVSGDLILSVLAFEDARFPEHSGLDFEQIKIALSQSYWDGAKLRGASTFSQQHLKNVLLNGERSLGRKLVEMIGALRLEHEFSKEEILGLYLAAVHFGEQLIGIENAAQFYFNTTPRKLTHSQSILLASLLPAPAARGANLCKGMSEENVEHQIKLINERIQLQKIHPHFSLPQNGAECLEQHKGKSQAWFHKQALESDKVAANVKLRMLVLKGLKEIEKARERVKKWGCKQ